MTVQVQKLLLIGEVEARSGIPIRTIRYYESLDLLQSSRRTKGGFRQFSPDVLTRLSFIKRTQGLGLSLEEIKDILYVYDRGVPPCGEIREKLENKLTNLDLQVEQLLTLRTELKELLSGWQDLPLKQEDKVCPILQPKEEE